MNKQLLTALSICNVVIYAGIGGLVGLMPLYLTQLRATPTVTGLFLAFAYLALALSNIVGGWLSGRFGCRKIFLCLGGLLTVPLTWLMSQTTTVGLLLLLMACLWFALGIPMTMVNILTGMASDAANRGRSFGVLRLSAGFGLFLGNLVSGPIVERWGFPSLFMAFASFYLLMPSTGWFVQEQRASVHTESTAATASPHGIFRNPTFTLLFVASICAQAANIVIFLSRPLIMDTLHFDATAISWANAVGSLVTLPLPLLIGLLTDRIGRKSILVACFLAPTLGLLVQMVAVHEWHFWLSSILSTIVGISAVVGSALVADMFVEESLSTGLSFLDATPWIGIVLGLSAGGMAINVFQMRPALVLAVLLSLAAVGLLMPISEYVAGKPEGGLTNAPPGAT